MESDVYREIGRRVAELRDRRGLTQEQLAEVASMSRSHVARVEAGSRQATVGALAAIAHALDVPVWHLFTESRTGDEELGAQPRELEIVQQLRRLSEEDMELVWHLAERLASAGHRPAIPQRPSARRHPRTPATSEAPSRIVGSRPTTAKRRR